MGKTQAEKIYEYMKARGEITQREAFYMGIQRLASRICDMKKNGIDIETELRIVKNRDGSTSHIAVYKLKEVA